MSAKILLFLWTLACHQDAIVSQTAPSPFCFYNNTIYKPGPVPSDDPCQSCDCSSGEVECYENPCDWCEYGEEPVQPEECCPKCKPRTCEYNGQIYQINDTFPTETCFTGTCHFNGDVHRHLDCCEYQNKTYQLDTSFTINPCTFGYCELGGEVSIAMADCFALFCPTPVYVKDECCARCPDDWVHTCTYQGETYNEGPIPTTDPCLLCECPYYSADVQCYSEFCTTCSYLEDAVYKPGKCCPDCQPKVLPTCTFKGQNYTVGPIPTTDPCQSCECPYTGGYAVCYLQTCTTCADNENAVYIPGQCCPECPTKTCTDAPPQVCEYNRQIHEFNSLFPVDSCTSGYCGHYGQVFFIPTCCQYEGNTYALSSGFKVDSCTLGYCESDGNVTIATTCCDELPCPNQVHDDGECCPRCPDDWVQPCYFEGRDYYVVGPIHTNDPCQTCECPPGGGDAQCVWETCPSCGFGQVTTSVPDHCCPICQVKVCDYNGQIYEVGVIPTNDPCLYCECLPWGGPAECYATTCPPCADDEYDVSYPDQCCPVCTPITTTLSTPLACQYNGQTYEIFSTFTIDVCTTGYCQNDGEVSLAVADCNQPCLKPVIVPGRCCQNCLPACEFQGQIYDPGQIPTSDPCLHCYCPPGGGEPDCYSKDCASCPDSGERIIVPGKCCPDCQARPTTPTVYGITSEPPTPTMYDSDGITSEPTTPTVYGITSEPPTPTVYDSDGITSEPTTPTVYGITSEP